MQGFIGLLFTLFEQKNSLGCKIYGNTNMLEFMRNTKFMIGHKILSYSFYDIFSQQNMKGLMNQEDIDQVFKNINLIYNDDFKGKFNQINDASEYIKQDLSYQDSNIDIIPVKSDDKNQVIQYICQIKKLPPKINKQKVDNLQIPKFLIAQFFKGEIIEVDGMVLDVKNYMEKEEAAPAIFILDCPNEEVMKQIITANQFNSYFQNNLDQDQQYLQYIFLNSPEDILLNKEFQEWLSNFDADVLLTNIPHQEKKFYIGENEENLYKHLQTNQYFQIYFPNIFPQIPSMNRTQIESIQQEYIKSLPTTSYIFYNMAQKCYQYQLFRNTKIRGQSVLFNNYYNITKENISSIKNMLIDEQIIPERFQQMLNEKFDPKIIFLGTGSQMPSVLRNVSCIIVNQPNINIMFDCGEGSIHQFINHFQQNYIQELIKLKLIFITHIHGDHHLGLLSILKERQQHSQDPVFLVLPFNMASWLEMIHAHIEALNIITIFSQSLNSDGHLEINNFFENSMSKNPKTNKVEIELYQDPNLLKFVKIQMDKSQQNLKDFETFMQQNEIKRFYPIPVEHCPQSYGILLQFNNDFKITYTGDCVFSKSLLKFQTDVLIHEATYDNDLQSQAEQNMHSTISDAVKISKSMGAWRLFLTHFSQRYQKISFQNPPITENQEEFNYLINNTIIAYDHMHASLSNLGNLPQISQIIGNLLPENSKDNDKEEKKQKKKQK